MIDKRLLASALAALLAAHTAGAAEAGWYLGGGVGQASPDVSQDELDLVVIDTFEFEGFPVVSGSSQLEDEDTSFSVFAGYRFNPSLAVEAGYVNLGTAEYRSVGAVNPPGPIATVPATYGADFEVTGFTLGGVAGLPLGEAFDLHARLGVLFADLEISESASIGTIGASETYSSSTTEIYYGVGAGYTFGGAWSINFDWARYADVGDEEETGEADVDNLALSVSFHF